MVESIVVPPAGNHPRLRFQHWHSFSHGDNGGDYGEVQIRPEGGDWEAISGRYTWFSSGIWTQPALSLERFAGQRVQLGFFFRSDDLNNNGWDVSSGWYIDDVEVVEGEQIFTNPEGFESEDFWSHWDADFSVWQRGTPTSGPGEAFSGQNAIGTIIGGNYFDNRTSRLRSPLFTVPAKKTRLRFQHWHSFSHGDSGGDSGILWRPNLIRSENSGLRVGYSFLWPPLCLF